MFEFKVVSWSDVMAKINSFGKLVNSNTSLPIIWAVCSQWSQDRYIHHPSHVCCVLSVVTRPLHTSPQSCVLCVLSGHKTVLYHHPNHVCCVFSVVTGPSPQSCVLCVLSGHKTVTYITPVMCDVCSQWSHGRYIHHSNHVCCVLSVVTRPLLYITPIMCAVCSQWSQDRYYTSPQSCVLCVLSGHRAIQYITPIMCAVCSQWSQGRSTHHPNQVFMVYICFSIFTYIFFKYLPTIFVYVCSVTRALITVFRHFQYRSQKLGGTSCVRWRMLLACQIVTCQRSTTTRRPCRVRQRVNAPKDVRPVVGDDPGRLNTPPPPDDLYRHHPGQCPDRSVLCFLYYIY